MQKKVNFNEDLEKGLERVGYRVAENINREELHALPEREVIKKSIQSIAEVIAPAATVSTQSSRQGASSSPHLPAYMDNGATDDNIRRAVEHLVNIALSDNLEKAVKESRKYPAFIEDAFHDALVDKLVPELRRRGILGK